MTDLIQKLAQGLDDGLHASRLRGIRKALLGAGDEARTLFVEGRGREWVFARVTGHGAPWRVLCAKVMPLYGLPVHLEKNANDDWEVTEMDTSAGSSYVEGRALPAVPQHNWTHGAHGPDPIRLAAEQFSPLLTHPTEPAASLSVYLEPLTYLDDDGVLQEWLGATVNLSSYVPTGADEQRIVIVGLDKDTNASVVLAADAVVVLQENTIYVPFTIENVREISIPANVEPSYAVRLYKDQTTIQRHDIFKDLRRFLGATSDLYPLDVVDNGDNAFTLRTDGEDAFSIDADQRIGIHKLLNLRTTQGVTIASGAISITASRVQVSAESGTTDTLSTITSGMEGDLLLLIAAPTHVITLDNAGNITTSGSASLELTDKAFVVLIRHHNGSTDKFRYASEIPALPASKITSGTFADARIAESNVTQHQAALAIAGSQLTGNINNIPIGQTTPRAGTFTALLANTSLGVNSAAPVVKAEIGGGQLLLDTNGITFAATKFNSQGAAWNTITTLPSLIFQGGSTERPEISWYRGSRTYPEFSLRQHTTSDTGFELYVGGGTVAPRKFIESDRANSAIVFGDGTTTFTVRVNGAAGTQRSFEMFTASSRRWGFGANTTAEPGSDVGSDFSLFRYNDSQVFQSVPFFAKRSTGFVGINNNSPSAQLHVLSSGATIITSIIQGAASQTGNLTEWQNSSATPLTYIEADGEIVIDQDSKAIKFGADQDATILYDGTDLIINPKAVGSGTVKITGDITLLDEDIILGTTTGTKLGTATSQKLSLWNATPIVQPTTAVAAATFVANTSGIVNDTATFDGYTLGQVVKALRNIGALA